MKLFIPFRQLKVGESFRFSSEVTFPGSGMRTGTAIKMSARTYRYLGQLDSCRVGSNNVDVFRVPATQAEIDAEIAHWAKLTDKCERRRDRAVYESGEYWKWHDRAMSYNERARRLMPAGS